MMLVNVETSGRGRGEIVSTSLGSNDIFVGLDNKQVTHWKIMNIIFKTIFLIFKTNIKNIYCKNSGTRINILDR